MKNLFLDSLRSVRVAGRQLAGTEPLVRVQKRVPLEYHGNAGYGGWAIPKGAVNQSSVIVDVGLGEDISFSESLIRSYGCTVHGADPTPKSIAYVKQLSPPNFILYEQGLAGVSGHATFYLPNEASHVSGSIAQAGHVGHKSITVELISLSDLFTKIGTNEVAVLKIDIEGSEYDVIGEDNFAQQVANVKVICIEFHHRWKEFGPQATVNAINKLKSSGFQCV